MNMKKLITITAMATSMLAIGAGTFESIPFNQPTFSEADPLGVTAITTAKNTADQAKEKATALETTIAETIQKGQLTNDVVVVGNVKGAAGAGMEANSTSIVFAVNRDLDEMQADNGQILFAADGVKFNVGLDAFWIGNDTLATILSNAGQGEVNAIVGIQTNGQDVAIDGNRKVNITIPAPGEANVITSITTNGVALPINAKAVEIPLQDYVKLADLQEGITFNTMNVTNLTINGKQPSLEGHTHTDKLDATNGVAYVDFKVYPMPSGTVGQSHTIITHESISIGDAVEYKENEITHNGESYEFGSDTNGIARLKDVYLVTNGIPESISTITTRQTNISAAALNAIEGINNAQDIATIKSTLTNFLNQFVIPAP